MKSIFTTLLLFFAINAGSQEIWNYAADENCPPVGTYMRCAMAVDEEYNYYPVWAYRDTSLYILYPDTLDFSGCSYLMLGGTSSQYVKGDGSYATFPTNNTAFTNGAGYLTSSSITGKLNISDTASMLSPYLRSSVAATTYSLLGHTHTFASLTSKPTTLSGYGVTDPVVTTAGSYANPAWITSLDYTKLTNVPSSTYVSAPFIEVTKSAAQTITANSLTTVTWGAESTKNGFTHSNSTNNSRITLDANGNYEGGVTLWVSTWNSVTPSRFEIQLFKNGSFYKELYDVSILSSNDPSISVPFTITNGTAGDYYEIKFLQNSGANRDITTTSFYWIKKI